MSLSLAKREAEEEENSEAEGAETTPSKDQICSASIVERLGTHQISVGLRGTPSKTNRTRRKMTKMLVNILILVLLHMGEIMKLGVYSVTNALPKLYSRIFRLN